MTLLNTVNVGGTDFGLLNSTIMGVCSTPAGSEIKTCTFADSFELKAGVVVTIKFTYANTYGDGSATYPKLSINGVTGAIRDSAGTYASSGCWNNQALVPFLYDGTDFTLLVNNVTDTVASNNKYSVSSKGVSEAISLSEDEIKTGGVWINTNDIYTRVFSYNAISFSDQSSRVVDSNFPIPKNKIVSLQATLISPNWASVPSYLYVTTSGSTNTLYVAQNITLSETVTVNVIVRYVK